MLTISNVKKTFNKGTINEKKALNCIDPPSWTREILHHYRRKRSRKIHDTECHCRCLAY